MLGGVCDGGTGRRPDSTDPGAAPDQPAERLLSTALAALPPDLAAELLALHRSACAARCRAQARDLLDRLTAAHREERVRVSRELHDRAAHAVRAGLAQLELYAHETDTGTGTGTGGGHRLELAERVLREALEAIREVSTELRAVVGPAGLVAAVGDYLRDHVPPRVRTRLEVDGPVHTLPPATAEELFLALREAVRNAVTHADPTELSVRLATDGTGTRVLVRDDGAGIDARRAVPGAGSGRSGARRGAAGGTGLESMRERVELLGGTLRVSPAPGGGTTVEAWVP